MIDFGFLIEPRNEYFMWDNYELQYEYANSLPASRVIIAQYESLYLPEVVLADGTIYTNYSTNVYDNGDAVTQIRGDLRMLANWLFTDGMNRANKGEGDDPQSMVSAMMTRGVYENCKKKKESPCVMVHGFLGGAGMASIVKSTENEWSHEVGHNWMGHYTGGFGGAVHSPSNDSGCTWGYDMKRRRFIQNFNKKNTVAINVQMQHVGQRILASTHGEKEQCLEVAGLDGKNYRYILYIPLERPCKFKKNWKKNLCMIQAPLLALANGNVKPKKWRFTK